MYVFIFMGFLIMFHRLYLVLDAALPYQHQFEAQM